MFLIASQNYKVGDVIYDGKPFVRVIRQDLWDKVCANCLKSGSHFKMCGACGVMRYCGKFCQKKAWKDHKLECPYLRNYTYHSQQEMVQMIGNIILKINGRDWKIVTESILGTEVSFDELESHADTPGRNIDLMMNFMRIKIPLLSYIGKENIPDEKTLLTLVGKVMYNRFGFIRDEAITESVDGCCLFIGASKFDHSCVPNSVIKNNGTSIVFRAIKPIRKSEKITFSYCSMIEKIYSSILHQQLKRSFGRNCYCNDCSQPYGQSALTKVIDMSKAFSVLEETKNSLELATVTLMTFGNMKVIFLEMLRQLLEEQEGVLGNTNLYRMRTLAWRCLILDGPIKEMRNELKQLADAMIEVWGEYYPELLCVYMKLIEVNMNLRKRHEAFMYAKKACQLRAVCFGVEYDNVDIYAQVLCYTVHHFKI